MSNNKKHPVGRFSAMLPRDADALNREIMQGDGHLTLAEINKRVVTDAERAIEEIEVKITNTRLYLREWAQTIPKWQAVEFLNLMMGKPLPADMTAHRLTFYMRKLEGLNRLYVALKIQQDRVANG